MILFKIAFGIGPGESGVFPMLVALVVLSWPSAARLVRGQILQIRNEGYIGASRLLGAKTGYLVLRHMIPNTIGVILVTLTFEMPRAIFIEAFLSFIGMGVAPPTPSWGSMSNEGIKTMLAAPARAAVPGAVHQHHGAGVQLARRRLARRARRPHARPRMSAAAAAAVASPVLEVRDLHVEFDTYGGIVKAVRGASFSVAAGKTLAIVGESGCGKSVSVQSIMGLIPMPPGRITAGTALLDGVDIIRQKIVNGDDVRGNRIGMIFQDPMSSLNPTMKVGDQIAETLQVHRGLSSATCPRPRRRAARADQHSRGGAARASSIRSRSRAACCSAR